MFFEGIGILLQRRLLDTKMVEDLFGGSVARAWEQVKTDVSKGRQRFNDPTIYYYFEYLYGEMKKREQKFQPKSCFGVLDFGFLVVWALIDVRL